MAVYWLQVTEPGRSARVVTVEGALDVGRDGDDLVIDDPTVSRHHCQVAPAQGGILVADCGSANGTWVDGSRIEDSLVAQPGQTIAIGETELVVVQGRETERSAPAEVSYDPKERASEAARELNKAGAKGGLGTYRKR